MSIGRPAKMSPSASDLIAKRLARGATHQEIANAVGISLRTLTYWLTRGRRADVARRDGKKVLASERPFLQLFDEIKEAEEDEDYHAVEQINQHIKIGVDLGTAAEAIGISFRQLERLESRATQIRNRRDDGERIDAEGLEYLKLFDGSRQATARMKVQALASLQKAILHDWKPAVWWLERTYPEEFGSPNLRAKGAGAGRPIGASSAPDRPSTADPAPPRIRLRRAG